MDAAAREPYVAESDASKIAWSHYMASPEAKVSRKSVGPQGKTPSRAPSRQTGRTPAPTPASTPPPLLFERALAPQVGGLPLHAAGCDSQGTELVCRWWRDPWMELALLSRAS